MHECVNCTSFWNLPCFIMSHSAGFSAVWLLLSASASDIAALQPFPLSLPRIHSQKTRQMSPGPDTPKSESTQRLQSQGPMVSLLFRNPEERSFHSSPEGDPGKYQVTETGDFPILPSWYTAQCCAQEILRHFCLSKESSHPTCSPQQANSMQESRPRAERSLYALPWCPAHTLPVEQELWAFVADWVSWIPVTQSKAMAKQMESEAPWFRSLLGHL